MSRVPTPKKGGGGQLANSLEGTNSPLASIITATRKAGKIA